MSTVTTPVPARTDVRRGTDRPGAVDAPVRHPELGGVGRAAGGERRVCPDHGADTPPGPARATSLTTTS